MKSYCVKNIAFLLVFASTLGARLDEAEQNKAAVVAQPAAPAIMASKPPYIGPGCVKGVCHHIRSEKVAEAQAHYAQQVRHLRRNQWGFAGVGLLAAGGICFALWKCSSRIEPVFKQLMGGPTPLELQEKIESLEKRVTDLSADKKAPVVELPKPVGFWAANLPLIMTVGSFAALAAKTLAVKIAEDFVVGVPLKAAEEAAQRVSLMTLAASLRKADRYTRRYPSFEHYITDHTMLLDRIDQLDFACKMQCPQEEVTEIATEIVEGLEVAIGYLKFFVELKTSISKVCGQFADSLERRANEFADAVSQGKIDACRKILLSIKYDVVLCLKHL